MRVRLGYTITSYPPAIGGAQLHAHMLARHLAPSSIVTVASMWSEHRTDWLRGTTISAPSETRCYDVDGIPVTRIGLTQRERLGLLAPVAGYLLAQSWAINAIARTLVPHLRLALADVDLIHNFRIGREPITYATWLLARELGVPFVLTPFHHPRWGGWLHRGYHRLYRAADAVLAMTRAEREVLVGLGVARERITVLGHGPVLAPEPQPERFRKSTGIAGPFVLFLGQKFAYKGLDALLQAAPRVWARYPEPRFVFIGPRTSHSRKAFANYSDSRIVEMDEMSLVGKTDALAACTLLCVPSSQESFGGVYTEAWALGKPVIGVDTPATRELIHHGKDGLLVSQTASSIADAILDVLSDPSKGQMMGTQGRAKVERHFLWPRIAKRAAAAYDEVLTRHGGLAEA
ncbi:MAG: glycosyltransferase family 4 protein [Chloroflexota bacterium]